MSEKQHGKLRKFNRAITNRLTKLFAGNLFYALVTHVGRKTGKEYSTPVLAALKNETIFVPLPYGADTDWFLNIQATGKCTIKIHRKSYSCINPEIVEKTTALPAFSIMLRATFERIKLDQFLRLDIL
jgi:deazaflavin-dependent oxidoreductase (nitroreductase family)